MSYTSTPVYRFKAPTLHMVDFNFQNSKNQKKQQSI